MAVEFKLWLNDQMQSGGWTQDSFGKAAGVSQVTVSQWLNGKDIPRPKALKKIAEITHTDPIWLFRLVDYLPPSGESGNTAMRPKVLAVLRELETLPDEILDLLADQIKHVLRPRAQVFQQGERPNAKPTPNQDAGRNSGDSEPSE